MRRTDRTERRSSCRGATSRTGPKSERATATRSAPGASQLPAKRARQSTRPSRPPVSFTPPPTCSRPPDPPFASRPRSASTPTRARGPFESDIPRYAAETSLSRPSPAPPSATLAGVGRYPRPSFRRVRDPPRRRAAARLQRATGRATATTRRSPASPRSPRLRRTTPTTRTRTTSPRRCPTRSRTNRGTPPTRTTTTMTSNCRAPEATRRLSSPPKARIGLAPFFLVQFPFYRLPVFTLPMPGVCLDCTHHVAPFFKRLLVHLKRDVKSYVILRVRRATGRRTN